MTDDIRREIRKLAAFISATHYDNPNHYGHPIASVHAAHVSAPWSVPHRDDASLLVYDNGDVVVSSCMESRHNGDFFDHKTSALSGLEADEALVRVRDALLQYALVQVEMGMKKESEEREAARKRTAAWDYLLAKGIIEK